MAQKSILSFFKSNATQKSVREQDSITEKIEESTVNGTKESEATSPSKKDILEKKNVQVLESDECNTENITSQHSSSKQNSSEEKSSKKQRLAKGVSPKQKSAEKKKSPRQSSRKNSSPKGGSPKLNSSSIESFAKEEKYFVPNSSVDKDSVSKSDSEKDIVTESNEKTSENDPWDVSGIPRRKTARKPPTKRTANTSVSPKETKRIKFESTESDEDAEETGTPEKLETKQDIENDEESTKNKRAFSPISDKESSGNSENDNSKNNKNQKSIKKRRGKKIISSDSESEEGDVNKSGDDIKDDGMKEEDSKSTQVIKKSGNSVASFFAPQKKSGDVKNDENEQMSSKSSTTDTTYCPSQQNYHPINDAFWKRGEKVPYLALSKTLEEIESISARLKMIETLANFFRSVIVLSPDDLVNSVYLCLNKVGPDYEGLELGLGATVLMKALARATGRTLDKVKAEVASKGDLGLVAETSRTNQRTMFGTPPKLTIAGVFSKFKEISQMSGNAAISKKIEKIQAMFVACRHSEARYLIRSLSGKLRIGLAEQSILAALAQAVVLTPPGQSYPPEIVNTSKGMSNETFKKKLEEDTLLLKTTYCECPNFDLIIPILLKEGIAALSKHCHLTSGIPLKPMLAHPTKGIDEVLKRFENAEFTCEYKYDGERAQIHLLEDGEVKIYSRNQENNTSKYPDIISRIPKNIKANVKSCIIDSEAVAFDRNEKQILPFQVLSTRKKKDAVESEIKVQVCTVAFDLLYLNGESLVKLPLRKRRDMLKDSFEEVESEFMFARSMDSNNIEAVQEFLEESVKGKCEGLMIKTLDVDATYEISKRSHNWLKLKKDYLDGAGDTLDLVVVGGFHGKGKRTGSYGGFLLACYDDQNEEFQTISKIGTGFKDEELEAHAKFFKENVIAKPKSYYRYDSSLEPDVWFEPVQVWEVKCADLSISPIHKAAAGIVDPEKGISLRFPRFLRIREDKKPENATSASQVAEMYNNQEQVKNQKSQSNKKDDDDEMYY